VSTEDNQEPEASRARQIAKARALLPAGAEIVAEFFDLGDSRSVPWTRRPETGRLLAELRAGANAWTAIVIGEFARAFGAPIQYSTTYPLLHHFGIDLRLPEIGGRVDYSSATTEMLLGMLGGTAKQERDQIRTRVRDGMTVLAQDGGRHLGGRPPYGYRLGDAGEHPNPKKRGLGQRLHRLEPDPVTGPVVGRIFRLFADGQGLKQIANTLTAEGVPSPSAHDRARNRHRDPRGWAHTAVRNLRNEKYLGRSVWGKQVRNDELLDLDDIAAGYITRQRWTDAESWVKGPDDAHSALVDRATWDRVQARIAMRSGQGQRGERSPRTTDTPYQLRGHIDCGLCERKMQGNQAHGILRYRCVTTQTRALPAYLADHPKAVYVREDAIVGPLDRWIGTELADPEWLAAMQEPEPLIEAQHARLRARLGEIDKATGNLIAAIEGGTDPALVNPRLAQLRGEREIVAHQLAHLAAPYRLTPGDIEAVLVELGGLTSVLNAATPPEKAAVYQALGVRLLYQPTEQTVVVTADLGRVLSRVGGPSRTPTLAVVATPGCGPSRPGRRT